MGKANYLRLLGLSLVVAGVPCFIEGDYYMSVLVFMGINSLVVIGLSLLMGYAGQISLGHAAFYGIGAYCTGVLTAKFGFSIPTAFLGGILLTTLVAIVIGIPALRLKGHYLAIATLGIGEIVYIIFNELMEWTGGPSGLSNIPGVRIGGFLFDSSRSFFYLVWAIVIVLLWFSLNIIHSRVGRALRSMHGSEVAAGAMGVNLSALKLQVFVLSAIYASIAGSLYAHFVNFIAPSNFGLMVSVMFLMMGVIGGLQTVWGAVFGAVLLTFLPEYLRVFHQYDILVYGAVLLAILLFMPEGVLEGIPSLLRKLLKKARPKIVRSAVKN
jgi:branched-chain amino acid transport system permease protein